MISKPINWLLNYINEIVEYEGYIINYNNKNELIHKSYKILERLNL